MGGKHVIGIRYILIFTLPIGIAILLHYGLFSLRTTAFQENADWLKLVRSSNKETVKAAHDSLLSGEAFRLRDWLNRFYTGSIIIGCILATFLMPKSSSDKRMANLFTVMVCGFCAAKFLIGFWYMGWIEFGTWLAVGFVCAVITVLLSNVYRNRSF